MKRKPEVFTGITLERWQSDTENIRWSQVEPRFRMLCSVVLHESAMAHQNAIGCSGERAFGRVEGYHMALEVLRSLGRRPPKQVESIEATHDEPIERSFKAADVYD